MSLLMIHNFKNLTGQQFGSLTVLKRANNVHKSRSVVWVCECQCGKKLEVLSTYLITGKYKSCGCKKYSNNPRRIDLKGQKFGKLSIISFYGLKKRRILWKCICDCGKIKIASTGNLKHGTVSSCGCKRGNPKHGNSGTRLYKIWNGMLDRCYRKDHISYRNYGAKGIHVCEQWRTNFLIFKEWALSNGYKSNLTIDRFPNNKGNYEPKNCRWATMYQQANNRSTNTVLNYKNKSHTIAEWENITGIPQTLITQRIHKLNWSIEDALTKPIKTQKNVAKRVSKA